MSDKTSWLCLHSPPLLDVYVAAEEVRIYGSYCRRCGKESP